MRHRSPAITLEQENVYILTVAQTLSNKLIIATHMIKSTDRSLHSKGYSSLSSVPIRVIATTY